MYALAGGVSAAVAGCCPPYAIYTVCTGTMADIFQFKAFWGAAGRRFSNREENLLRRARGKFFGPEREIMEIYCAIVGLRKEGDRFPTVIMREISFFFVCFWVPSLCDGESIIWPPLQRKGKTARSASLFVCDISGVTIFIVCFSPFSL